jgi:hypothetical protein
VDLLKKRKERTDSLFLKLRGNPLFVPRNGMNRIPARILRRNK